MTPPPTADETRARIVSEAERLFRHYGYAKTTVADIAEACAMSSANVYRFFCSKSAINEAICGLITSELESRLRKIAIADASASQRLTEFIELIAHYTSETYTNEKKVHEMVVVAMEENWGVIERHLQAARAMIAAIIESGVRSGEFKAQDPMEAARRVHFAIAGFSHPVLVAKCCSEPDTPTAAEIADFILLALRA
jgi:AcrR family transcriptional regulator